MIINNKLFPVANSTSSLMDMKATMERLQQQMVTGKKHQTMSELGRDRMADITLRSKLTMIEAYKQNITTARVRLDILDTAVSRLDQLESEVRAGTSATALDTDGPGVALLKSQSQVRLRETIELLNSEINGRYLFSGNKSDQKAVVDYETMMMGGGGKEGFLTVMDQRLQADQGADGRGRLTLDRTGVEITLTEDGDHPFGMKLSSITGTSPFVTTQPGGVAPQTMSVEVGSLTDGQMLTLGFTMPDGSTEQITLTATDGPIVNANQFAIGSTPLETATNLEALIGAKMDELGQTKLRAASNFAAADDFFAGNGQTSMRVDGPPYDSATALIAADPATTVSWYQGGQSDDPRRSVTVRADGSTEAPMGVQANETGFADLVRSLAVMAAQEFTGTDDDENDRLLAVAERVRGRTTEMHNASPDSIEGVMLDLGMTQTMLGRAQDRHDHQKVSLESILSDIEDVPIEEVAVKLMHLQTRLEASYQTTAIVAQMSFVNYL